MTDFAKIFEIDGIGQVVVRCGQKDDSSPAIFWHAYVSDMYVDPAFGFPDTDEGEAKRDKAFAATDAEKVAAFLGPLIRDLTA